MAQTIDGPVTINDGLTVNNSGGAQLFKVTGVTAEFLNIFAVGDAKVVADLSCQNVNCHSVFATGDIQLANADCAEEFDVGADISEEAGTVMVLGGSGALYPCLVAYDSRVAGVISGAGDFNPGIVLDKRQTDRNRQPVALLGKTFCKVDASYGAIEVGDMLTTSATPGYAMKADDPLKAFGAVIGKSLRPLAEGKGLIPILIARG